MSTIRETTVRELVTSEAVSAARVVGQRGGYALEIRYGHSESTLATSRGAVRLFTLEGATRFLADLGVTKFEVDATHYEPGRIRKPRPDRAEALRKTRTRPRQVSLV